MEKSELLQLLESYKNGAINQEEVTGQLLSQGILSLGYAAIDTDRGNRTGIPEVIYSEGKTAEQVGEIAGKMHERGIPVLATRASRYNTARAEYRPTDQSVSVRSAGSTAKFSAYGYQRV